MREPSYGTIRVLKDMPRHKAGEEIRVELKRGDFPRDRFWRRRLADAETDGCCELLIHKAATPEIETEASATSTEE